ncbi:MAG TPA: hypothetical protein VIH35_08265 [Kiritimatiellia bacterium]|jgi:hypothetical protein
MKLPQEPNAPRAFRNVGMVILLIGGGLAWFVARDKVDPDTASNVRLIVLATVIAAGICFISAAAKWFMKR